MKMDLSKILNGDWDYLYNNFQWFRDMRETEQDPKYHAEGNVEIHTKKVFEVSQRLIAERGLNGNDSLVLLLASLFHDIEKRSTTTTDEEGNIIAPGHARKGELTTRSILYRSTDLNFETREYICRLVRWHGLPLWYGDDIDKKIAEVSQLVKMEDLYYLAYADVHGRECNDKEDLLLRLEIFVGTASL
jgi:hypothetical protein